MGAVIYARTSSDLQSEASIADQVEVCRRYSVEGGWSVVETYSDAALSGAIRWLAATAARSAPRSAPRWSARFQD